MRTVMASILAAALVAAPAAAAPAAHVHTHVHGDDVLYLGGTLPGIKVGAVGKLDFTRDHVLEFRARDAKIEIPYKEIRSFHYAERLAHRMGALATIAVVIVKHRKRRHFVEIAYTGNEGVAQVAFFEVSKDAARPVVGVLEARAPRPCSAPRLNPPNQPSAPALSAADALTACRVQTPPIYIPAQ